MLVTTTPIIEGGTILEYCGIVFGEVTSGIDFTKDFFMNITNFIGGRSESYEHEVINARERAIDEMCERAESLGANAIIGVTVDCRPINIGDNRGSMLMVTASGTAVVLE